jgi:hypothetical protein
MDPSPRIQQPAVKEPRYGLRVAIPAIVIGILWHIIFVNTGPQVGMVPAEGVVVDQEISPKGLCEPIAEVTLDGATYRTSPGNGAEPCEFDIGDPIEVAYHPDDIPGTVEIPLDSSTRNALDLLSLLGVAVAIGGVLSLVANIRYRLRRQTAANR